jgi:hypothetical protein
MYVCAQVATFIWTCWHCMRTHTCCACKHSYFLLTPYLLCYLHLSHDDNPYISTEVPVHDLITLWTWWWGIHARNASFSVNACVYLCTDSRDPHLSLHLYTDIYGCLYLYIDFMFDRINRSDRGTEAFSWIDRSSTAYMDAYIFT